ncbi:MAG: hypothetical protein ACI8Y4_001059 [Candidatus Poriferisodalaceae bacterium]|jgi:hypothetical protein
MPLSENEQKILSQIEKDFYDSDPEFAREVGETTLYRHAFRNVKSAAAFGVLGVVGLIAALQIHYLLAFVAFLVVFGSTIVIERNLRKMGRAGLQQVAGNMRGAGVKDAAAGFASRFKGRIRRPDEKD